MTDLHAPDPRGGLPAAPADDLDLDPVFIDDAGPASLDERLEQLGSRLVADPPHDDSGDAMLVALLPCRSSAGEVAVACWESSEERRLYELVEIDTATRVSSAAALREALQLLAIVEALEDCAEPLRIRELEDQLLAWQEQVTSAQADPALASAAAGQAELTAAVWGAVEALQAIDVEVSPHEQGRARLADTARMEALAALLTRLGSAWQELESCTERWGRELAGSEAPEVEQLWRIIALARSGPLQTPPAAVVEAGRSAGTALAEDVLGDVPQA